MPLLRCKLRIALLVTLTGMSGLCAILLVNSWLRWISAGYDTGHSIMVVAVTPGVVTIQYSGIGTSSGTRQCILTWVERDVTPPWRLRDVLARFAFRWVDDDGTGKFLRQLVFPLWVPIIVLGTWPGLVAIKALGRRRRRPARGFDVAPTGDTADAV
jgi:hypothetical protein